MEGEVLFSVLLQIPNVQLFEIDENEAVPVTVGKLKVVYTENVHLLVLNEFRYSLSKEIPTVQYGRQIILTSLDCFIGLIFESNDT
jgi:hypothetical protein